MSNREIAKRIFSELKRRGANLPDTAKMCILDTLNEIQAAQLHMHGASAICPDCYHPLDKCSHCGVIVSDNPPSA
jgi:hypothetical protein